MFGMTTNIGLVLTAQWATEHTGGTPLIESWYYYKITH